MKKKKEPVFKVPKGHNVKAFVFKTALRDYEISLQQQNSEGLFVKILSQYEAILFLRDHGIDAET